MKSSQWWQVTLIVAMVFTVATWAICEWNTTGERLFVTIDPTPGYSRDALNADWREMVNRNPKGFAWNQCILFGWMIENNREWYGHAPAVSLGFPGGRWALMAGVFVLVLLMGGVIHYATRQTVQRQTVGPM